MVSNRNPLELPWKELGVDIVIESTGVFIDEEGAGKHIAAGAKRVRCRRAPEKGSPHLPMNPIREIRFRSQFTIGRSN